MDERPNLFSYATSELSQDAFICWLLAWADPRFAELNRPLHETGVEFVRALFRTHESAVPPEEIRSLKVKRQEGRIDVLAIVNGEWALLIEDKIHAERGGDQLTRYLAKIREDYSVDKTLGIYFKTGDEARITKVQEEEFEPFQRKDMLEVVLYGHERGVESDILRDYYDTLRRLDEAVAAFATKRPSQWKTEQWRGFFASLEKLLDGDWNYVPNPSRGFMGFWWSFRKIDGGHGYIQLEEENLVFKIHVDDRERRKSLRHQWHRQIADAARSLAFPCKRPSRFGSGTYMTVVVYDGEYRVTAEDGLLDLDATLSRLRRAEEVLELAVLEGQGEGIG